MKEALPDKIQLGLVKTWVIVLSPLPIHYFEIKRKKSNLQHSDSKLIVARSADRILVPVYLCDQKHKEYIVSIHS